MDKKGIMFSVYQYACWNKEINENFEELIRYMENNHIVLRRGQMVISGRVCEDLNIGDVLITQKGTLVNVEGFHAYGTEMDFMSAGMTCVLFADSIDEKLTLNQNLYFAKKF